MKVKNPATRIFGIRSRIAGRVVLLRRGPSKLTLMLTWDTDRHVFEAGQWFKGRVYEERCDLSPNGERFIYLAASNKPPYYSWTAVSRPPFFTALALWPNMGTWGGGGMFATERVIELNHLGSSCKLAPDFRLPRGVTVRSIGEWAGHGEDDPIRGVRMRRDGWVLADPGVSGVYKGRGSMNWEFLQPERWQKTCKSLTLERRLLGIGERNGPGRVREHRLLDPKGNLVRDFGRSDWADWSNSGELLLAQDGKVGRVVITHKTNAGEFDELLDLQGLRFQPVEAPTEATHWGGTVVQGRAIT